MKNIVLTGFMGTGKTTVAKVLAQKTGYTLIDTDALIVEKSNMKIVDIFAVYGEEHFRDLESECIKEVALKNNCIISTGGGTVLRGVNMHNLKKNGIIVNLQASFSTVIKRTSGNDERPLINQSSTDDIKKRYESRMKYYDVCDLKICTDDMVPTEIADEIISYYKRQYAE